MYAVLHECIYCQGESSRWAAHRVLSEDHAEAFDAVAAAAEGRPVNFTGEMIFPWMFDEIEGLRPFKEATEALAKKEDWPDLYDIEKLADNTVPAATVMYYEDMFVNFDLAHVRYLVVVFIALIWAFECCVGCRTLCFPTPISGSFMLPYDICRKRPIRSQDYKSGSQMSTCTVAFERRARPFSKGSSTLHVEGFYPGRSDASIYRHHCPECDFFLLVREVHVCNHEKDKCTPPRSNQSSSNRRRTSLYTSSASRSALMRATLPIVS